MKPGGGTDPPERKRLALAPANASRPTSSAASLSSSRAPLPPAASTSTSTLATTTTSISSTPYSSNSAASTNSQSSISTYTSVTSASNPSSLGSILRSLSGKDNNVPMAVSPQERMCNRVTSIKVSSLLVGDKRSAENSASAAATIAPTFPALPLAFDSTKEYIRAFEPHIVEEIRCGLMSNLTTITRRPEKFGRVLVSQAEHDLKNSVAKLPCEFLPSPPSSSSSHHNHNNNRNSNSNINSNSSNNSNDQHHNMSYEERKKCMPMPMDLVLFCDASIPFPLTKESFERSSIKTAFLAVIVRSTNRSDIRFSHAKTSLEIWKQFEHSENQKSKAAANINKSISKPNGDKKTESKPSEFYYVVLDNLISPWREYMSLFDLEHTVKMVDSVLCRPGVEGFASSNSSHVSKGNKLECHVTPINNQIDINTMNMKSNLPSKFDKIIKRKFNPSQYGAIVTACNTDGFVLIQGPPGTGKTSTAVGILNAIHLREYNKFYEFAIEALLSERGIKCRNADTLLPLISLISELTCHRPHVLVVAPTNVAVDNIIEKIFEKSFLDGNGIKYNPSIIRIGGGKGDAVKSVSLDDVVAEEVLASASEVERRKVIEEQKVAIHAAAKELFKFQGFLVNLRAAFSSHPLPPGWEVRINVETGMPYWVDHINKTASGLPPPSIGTQPIQFEKSQLKTGPGMTRQIVRNGDFTLQSLPDFQQYSFLLTQMLEKIETMNSKQKRYIAFSQGLDNSSEAARQDLESSIIDRAQIVFTTLNSAGHPSLEATKFEITLIDEAAQCVEPSVLVALRRGCRKCIMIGDPMQLPSVIFSEANRRAGYDRSLFERLVQNGHKYLMLDTQYRMHAVISEFPSRAFYSGKLIDGEEQRSRNYCPSYVASCNPFLPCNSEQLAKGNRLPPLLFFNLTTSKDVMGSTQSLSNREEAIFVVNIIRYLQFEAKRNNSKLGSIGVISPYSEQVAELRRTLQASDLTLKGLSSVKSDSVLSKSTSGREEIDVELNTVDGFQGREKDIIIISTVRSNAQKNIGFLADERRMNVAITRGKFGMFIVGNVDTLLEHPLWRDLINHCDSKGLLWTVNDSNAHIGALSSEIYSRARGAQPRPPEDTNKLLSEYAHDHHMPHQPAQFHHNHPPFYFHHSHFPNQETTTIFNDNMVHMPPSQILPARRRFEEVEEGEIEFVE